MKKFEERNKVTENIIFLLNDIFKEIKENPSKYQEAYDIVDILF